MDKTKMILVILCVALLIGLVIAINSNLLGISDQRDLDKIEELKSTIENLRKDREENYIRIDEYNKLRIENDSLGKELKKRERTTEDIYNDVSDNVDNASWDVKKDILTSRGYTVKGTGN